MGPVACVNPNLLANTLTANRCLCARTIHAKMGVCVISLMATSTVPVLQVFPLRGFYCTSARGWTTCFTTEVSARRTGFDRELLSS